MRAWAQLLAIHNRYSHTNDFGACLKKKCFGMSCFRKLILRKVTF